MRHADGSTQHSAASQAPQARQVIGGPELEATSNRPAWIETGPPTADCAACGKPIRRNRAGIWGARARTDPHPWYCDDDPGDDKRHRP